MGGRAIPMEDRMRETTPRSIEETAQNFKTRESHHQDIIDVLCLIAQGLALCAQKIHELKPQAGTTGRPR